MLATGNIRNYQILVGGLQMLNLPLSYICLRLGFIPESVLIIAIIISICCLAARLYMLRSMIGLSVKLYVQKVILNVMFVTLLASVLPYICSQYLCEGFISFLIITLITIVCTVISIFYIGCNKSERKFIVDKFKKVINKKNDTSKESC